MRHVRWVLVFAVGALALCQPRTSTACFNEIIRSLPPVQNIALAEKDLEKGLTGEVLWRVRTHYPQIRGLGPDAPPLALRAQRIFALALVRADGRLDSQLGWTRWANLEWAVETLAALDAKRPNDPGLQADLAEAQTRLPRTRREGLHTLEDLDRRDLLGSPFAYLALVRARRAIGDDLGAAHALERCVARSEELEKLRCAADFSGEPVRAGS